MTALTCLKLDSYSALTDAAENTRTTTYMVSRVESGTRSPNPTVVIVTIAKYIELMYWLYTELNRARSMPSKNQFVSPVDNENRSKMKIQYMRMLFLSCYTVEWMIHMYSTYAFGLRKILPPDSRIKNIGQISQKNVWTNATFKYPLWTVVEMLRRFLFLPVLYAHSPTQTGGSECGEKVGTPLARSTEALGGDPAFLTNLPHNRCFVGNPPKSGHPSARSPGGGGGGGGVVDNVSWAKI